MPSRPRYAWGTKVSIDKSRSELMGLLAKHGVEDIATTHSATRGDAVRFRIGERWFELAVPRPTFEDVKVDYARISGTWDDNRDAEWRRRWRAQLMLLKMKLEFIETGESTVENELMSHMLLRDGQTLAEAIRASDGSVPLLVASIP